MELSIFLVVGASLGFVHSLVLLSIELSLFLLNLRIDYLHPFSEIFLYLGVRRSRMVDHPRVRHYFSQSWSMRWRKLQARLNEIFEIFREEVLWFSFTRLHPEKVSSVNCKAFVINIVVCGLNERWMLRNHDKQDDSS